MAVELDAALAQRLQTEQIAWITTVRADGTPVPTPVWFYWNGETFLIYTQPESHKLRNLAQHDTVTLNFNTDSYGGSVAVFTGKGYVDDQPAPAVEWEAYLEKYTEGIKMLGMSHEEMAQRYSTVLRVRPERVRAMPQ